MSVPSGYDDPVGTFVGGLLQSHPQRVFLWIVAFQRSLAFGAENKVIPRNPCTSSSLSLHAII